MLIYFDSAWTSEKSHQFTILVLYEGITPILQGANPAQITGCYDLFFTQSKNCSLSVQDIDFITFP